MTPSLKEFFSTRKILFLSLSFFQPQPFVSSSPTPPFQSPLTHSPGNDIDFSTIFQQPQLHHRTPEPTPIPILNSREPLHFDPAQNTGFGRFTRNPEQFFSKAVQNNYLESNGLKESRELDYPEHQYAPHEYDALEYVAPAPVPAPNYPEVKYPEPLRPQALIQPRPLDHAAPAGSTAAIPVPEVKYHNNVESNLDRIRNLIKENRNLIAAQVIKTLIKHYHQVIKC